MNLRRVLALTLSLAALWGCGGDSSSPVGPNTVPTGIGLAGGTVASASGASVVVPPNALSQVVDIQISQSSQGAPALPAGTAQAGDMHAFTPHGTTFAQPVTVTIPFDPAKIPASSSGQLLKTNAANTAWEVVPNTTVSGNTVRGVVSSFSHYVYTYTQVPEKPVFTLLPGNATVVEGIRAIFYANATAGGAISQLTYQWQRNGVDIPGATSVVSPGPNPVMYVTPDTVAADNGALFSVRVSNAAGSISSGTGKLQVISVPTFISQPANATVTTGQTATFSASLQNGALPLTFQWRKNGVDIAGASGSAISLTQVNYSTPATVLADNGAKFSVVVTNQAGTATSVDAALTVIAPVSGPTITTQPQNATVNAGQTASFSVTATGTAPLTYQWRRNAVAITGANAATFVTAATTAADNGALYSVVVSNAAGSVTSGNATLTVVTPLTVKQVKFSASSQHQLLRLADGTFKVRGFPYYGNFGGCSFGASEQADTPYNGPVLNDIAAVSAGGHALFLKNDGTVWAYGCNTHGQLGNGSTVDSPIPVQAQGLTGVVAIAAGDTRSLALKSDGTVWAWGANQGKELGIGVTSPNNKQTTPVQIPGLSNVVAIGAGTSIQVAVTGDGAVWTWGYNGNGDAGNGDSSANFGQKTVPNPTKLANFGNVVAVDIQNDHVLALKSDGTVWGWGRNLSGELGDGSTAVRYSPVQAIGVTGAVAIAIGFDHSLALKSDGTVWAWGDNNGGQLGRGTLSATPITTPAPGLLGLTGVVAIVADSYNSLALKSDGTVWAVGIYMVASPAPPPTGTPRTLPINLN